jgi:hypothetical protein
MLSIPSLFSEWFKLLTFVSCELKEYLANPSKLFFLAVKLAIKKITIFCPISNWVFLFGHIYNVIGKQIFSTS